MKKFDALVEKFYSGIVFEQEPPPQMPQDGGPVPAPAAAPGAPPAPPTNPSAEPVAKDPNQPLTPEGKKFLVELALKALAVDPATISESDKAIFETPVTTANADHIADRIKQIVEGL